MTTHTPAPWRINRYGQEQILHTEPHGRVYIICTLTNHKEQGQADAALIAAAPELLDALHVAKAIIDKDIDLTDEDYEQITRAIQKAEGK